MRNARQVEALLAIRELVEAYNDAVMRFDAQDWVATWAEDAVWVLPGAGETQGREAIGQVWSAAMSELEFVGFFASAGPLRVDGERGSGRWYQQEFLHYKDGAKRAITGRYDDEYQKSEGRWLFRRRSYSILHAEVQPPPSSSDRLGRA